MPAVIILGAVALILLVAFVVFYFYSRTLAWGESDTRKSILGMLMVVGPLFGMHYKKPHIEPPAISTKKKDD